MIGIAKMSDAGIESFEWRSLTRVTVRQVGSDLRETIWPIANSACTHLDFLMNDPGIDRGITVALEAGYVFRG